MTGTTSVAVRSARVEASRTAQSAQPQGALTLRAGQARFDEQQRAALATLGIKADAPQADLDVFLHVSQRMGLDPFAKQIHLIYYRVNEGVWNPRTRQWDDNWIEKPSIQTGIAGFRVQRDRVAARLGVLIDYEDTLWYNDKGEGFDVWLWDDPPTACRVAVKISDGRRFSATLRFGEFAKKARNGQLTGRWRDAHSYQIEKCAEAAALRKAFPQDFAGIDLDAEIESDPDAPPPAPPQPERQRVTAEQIRQRQPVPAEVVPEDVPPAETAPGSPPSGQRSAGGASASGGGAAPPAASAGQCNAIGDRLEHLGYDREDEASMLRVTAKLAGYDGELSDPRELTADQAANVLRRLQSCTDGTALQALLEDGEVPGGE